MFSEREILEIAIRMEKNGENEYRRAMGTASDQALASLLEWMAAEEQEHGVFFSGLLEKLETLSESPFGIEMDATFLKDLIGGSALSLKSVDFAAVDSVDDLLDIFVGFEEDSILFYRMILPMIEDGETRSQVEKIITEEKKHISRLETFRKS